MGTLLGWIEHNVREGNVPSERVRTRRLDGDDYETWYEAGNERAKAPAPKTVEQLKRDVKAMNPIRWMQIQGDLRWIKKQLKKLGYPDVDPRSLL